MQQCMKRNNGIIELNLALNSRQRRVKNLITTFSFEREIFKQESRYYKSNCVTSHANLSIRTLSIMFLHTLRIMMLFFTIKL